MNINQIKAPIPKRAPKLVTPKSPAPWDIAAAITAMEHDAYRALIKEPAEAAGITPPPELPGPGTLGSMLVSPLQGFFAGLTKGAGVTQGAREVTEPTAVEPSPGAIRRREGM